MYVCPNGLINILLQSLLKGVHPVGISRTHIYPTVPREDAHAFTHMEQHLSPKSVQKSERAANTVRTC